MKKTVIISMIVLLTLSSLPVYGAVMGSTAAQDFVTESQEEAKRNLDPVHEKAKDFFLKGEKLFNNKKYSEAVKYFYAAVKTEDSYKDAWKQVGFCYYQMKNHKYAYTAFKKVLELDKNDKDAKQFMEYYSDVMNQNKKNTEKREMIDSIWRSAAFPGLGQIYNGQMLKGILISAGFLVSIGLMTYNIIDQNTKVEKYEKTNENHDIAYTEAENAGTAVLIFSLAAGALYAAGIVDAALNYDVPEARQAFQLQLRDNEVMAMVKIKY